MLDLVSWGVAAGFIFKPIIEELAKDATKDWVKDMFKSGLSNVVKLPEKEPLEKAAKKALGKFLEEFKEQLQDAELDDKTVREYIQPLKKFLGIKQVREGLGSAFFEVQGIDTTILSKIWQTYNLKELPNDFDWNQLSKRYVRKIKDEIIPNNQELREILKAHNLDKISDKYSWVRRTAIEQLFRQFKDDKDLFNILLSCAVNDPFQRKFLGKINPRQTALKYLIQLFPHHPQLKDILQDRLENDPDEEVREYVRSIIDTL